MYGGVCIINRHGHCAGLPMVTVKAVISPSRHLDKLSALVKSLYRCPFRVPGPNAVLFLNMRLLQNKSVLLHLIVSAMR